LRWYYPAGPEQITTLFSIERFRPPDVDNEQAGMDWLAEILHRRDE
jgi:hypothetical protein